MPWGRIDDTFWRHEKLQRAGPLGMALFAASISYCNDRLTDGFIPDVCLWQLLNCQGLSDEQGPLTTERVAEFLIDAGLWERVPGGYKIHDYLDYNKSKAEILAQREQARIRMNILRRSGDVRPNIERTSDAPVPGTRYPVPEPGTRSPEPGDHAPAGAAGASAPARRLPAHAEQFQALAQVCGYDLDHLTKPARGEINAAAKHFDQAGFTGEDIARVAEEYQRRFADCELTPSALVKHASRLNRPRSLSGPGAWWNDPAAQQEVDARWGLDRPLDPKNNSPPAP